jgi:predicted homoserine dehydrogenase-like protein
MRMLKELLTNKEEKKEYINVAIIGSGWFGSGLIRELYHWPCLIPKLIITRTKERALKALKYAGVENSEITEVTSVKGYHQAVKENKFIVSENLEPIKELKDIDVVFEATGIISVGAECAVNTINQGTHFLTANIEMDATIGFAIDELAREKGVIYSAGDGDQPAVLSRMIDEIELYGFKVVVAGSCKGFLDVHQTPEGVKPWVRPGHNPKIVASFADGTKQALEMTSLANGRDLVPDIRGMHGPVTTKKTLVKDFLKVIRQDGIVDYAMGIKAVDEAAGVFVIGSREGKFISADLDYLKKGKGPYYLFFRGHHLCYFETAKSIAEAVLFNIATLPHKERVADVLTVAKKDLKAGEKLDGIGGFTVYGLIDSKETVKKESLLPVGLSEYAVLKKDISKDTPVTLDMVDYPEENIVLELRKKEENTVPT